MLPVASDGGPTIKAHGTTAFPLLQTVFSEVGSIAAPDPATVAGGGTLSSSSASAAVFSLGNSAVGVNNVPLTAGNLGILGGKAGTKEVAVWVYDTEGVLSWTNFGFWDVASADSSRLQGAFVTGYATPVAAIPTSGTGTFAGSAKGQGVFPQAGSLLNGLGYSSLSGRATITADFAGGKLVGTLTNMYNTPWEGAPLPWNDVTFTATFTPSQNLFSGVTSTLTALAGSTLAAGPATGTITGMFMGPQANELGAVWTLSDGVGSAFGSLAAVRNDACMGCWDY
jgi:hypothetical protein